ncbi:MAG: hypothetical protein WA116_05205, partial [Anaerolineaceae bacterium]
EGKQVEESRAEMELETDFPAPTAPPNLTIVPETPFPTIVWPTRHPVTFTFSIAHNHANPHPSSISINGSL